MAKMIQQIQAGDVVYAAGWRKVREVTEQADGRFLMRWTVTQGPDKGKRFKQAYQPDAEFID
jgi:hypothetical protein